tara:strand:+ start:673 stop:873 length:201 start_codon:yes stop_codon:yes gene_type:complete
MKYLVLLFLLTGCAASPATQISKDISLNEICAGNDIGIYYTTNVNIEIKADTEQDLKDLFKVIPIP